MSDTVELGTTLEELAENLSCDSRRIRQKAAAALCGMAKDDPASVLPAGPAILDALNRPEARTRWECLDILTLLVPVDSRFCDKALSGAETALFDEDNGTVRLSAFRFLCKLGATTLKRADKAWLLLDEALQCYHGDLEYNDMLAAAAVFASGKASADVKQKLVDRVSFDAKNGRGPLQRKSQAIIDNAS